VARAPVARNEPQIVRFDSARLIVDAESAPAFEHEYKVVATTLDVDDRHPHEGSNGDGCVYVDVKRW